MNDAQITRVNDGSVVAITAVPLALIHDEEVSVTQMIPQVATWSRSKRRIVKPEIHDSKEQDPQDSPERKWRSVISNTSSICIDCAYHALSHLSANF